MSIIIENLYNEFGANHQYFRENQRISTNREMLAKTLNKWQRKLLLDIYDDLSLINSKVAEDYFQDGFRLGAQMVFEVFRDTIEKPQ